MSKILVCGSRYWTDKAAIRRELEKFPADTVIIHGAARGADSLAGEVALELGFKVEVYPADWSTHGRAAGPIRNMRMYKEGKPEQVLAFHENIEDSKGTGNMIKIIKEAGVPYTIFKC